MLSFVNRLQLYITLSGILFISNCNDWLQSKILQWEEYLICLNILNVNYFHSTFCKENSFIFSHRYMKIDTVNLLLFYRTLNAIAPFALQQIEKKESGKTVLSHTKSMATSAAPISLYSNKLWDIGRIILASNSLKETQRCIRTILFSLKDLVGKLFIVMITFMNLNQILNDLSLMWTIVTQFYSLYTSNTCTLCALDEKFLGSIPGRSILRNELIYLNWSWSGCSR